MSRKIFLNFFFVLLHLSPEVLSMPRNNIFPSRTLRFSTFATSFPVNGKKLLHGKTKLKRENGLQSIDNVFSSMDNIDVQQIMDDFSGREEVVNKYLTDFDFDLYRGGNYAEYANNRATTTFTTTVTRFVHTQVSKHCNIVEI